MRSVIIIPARYASSRLPGKPLVHIAGIPMLTRVYTIAQLAIKNFPDIEIIVATDDTRIAQHCSTIGAPYLLTDVACATGTDRAFAAVRQLKYMPNFIINLQGDTPLTPPWFIAEMLTVAAHNPSIQVLTPFVRLTWPELAILRNNKRTTPFSGACVTINRHNNQALWFSKQIIPAIRDEALHLQQNIYSPVCRHIGIYGYSYAALQAYCNWPAAYYEKLEGLEQLRFLENNINIHMLEVTYRGRSGMSGVDSPEDVQRAASIIAAEGELNNYESSE